MDTPRPLETTVRPKGPAFLLPFAQELVPLFQGSDRVSAEATSDGLVLRCIWEPDLEAAQEIIQTQYRGELTWSPNRIQYRRDTWLQEPILFLRVRAAAEYLGNVIGDLSSRRGIIAFGKVVADATLVEAEVPLAELGGYLSTLRTLTNGTGVATATFHSYQTAPNGRGPDPDEPMSAALRA